MQVAKRTSQIDTTHIKLGARMVDNRLPIYYKGRSLIFQTPYLEVQSTRPTGDVFTLTTLFSGSSEQKLDSFFQFIENMEKNIGREFISRAEEFGLRGNMRIKKLAKNTTGRPDGFYIPWPISTKNCRFVDNSRGSFDPTEIAPGYFVRLIVKLKSFWINGSECGLTTVVQKVMVYPREATEYDFDEDQPEFSEEDDSDIVGMLSAATVMPREPIPSPSPSPVKTKVTQFQLPSPDDDMLATDQVLGALDLDDMSDSDLILED